MLILFFFLFPSRLLAITAVFGYWVGGIDLVWWTRGMLGDDQLNVRALCDRFFCPCLLTRTSRFPSPQVLTFFTAFFLCATHAITCSCVEERILISREDDNGKEAGGPMHAIGEIWTTIKTLPRPIRQVFHVQVRLGVATFRVLAGRS